MGVERTSGTDTRTETVDEPTSQEQHPYTPPPDNPGSPGRPSRLESRARARELPQQQNEAEGTGSAGRDVKPASPRAEDDKDVTTTRDQDQDDPAKEASDRSTDEQQLQPNDTSGDSRPGEAAGEQPESGEQEAEAPNEPADASGDLDRRISGEGLLPDDNLRVTDIDEDAVERGLSDRLKQVVAKLDRSDTPNELSDTVDRPDFQDPSEDPADLPDRYGTPLERTDGTRTPLFDGEPKREQTEQGDLGDCGIIATLGAVAGHHPEAIRDCVRETDDGNYQVRLHEAKYSISNRYYEPTGRHITLTVTPDLPVYDQHPGKTAFADSTSTGAAWAPVLEKAIAGTDQTWSDERRDKATRIWNARGNPGDAPTGYVRLNQGSGPGDRAELLTQLTGRPAKTLEFPSGYDNQGRSADRQLSDEIADQLSGNKPVLVGTRSRSQGESALPKGLFQCHAYEVTKVDDRGMLHLRNPWNAKHPEPMTIQEFKASVRPRYSTLE